MTDDDLRDDLTDIQGVGDATAEKILDVVAEHDTEQSPYLAKAMDAVRAGDDRNALVYLGRAARDRDSDR